MSVIEIDSADPRVEQVLNARWALRLAEARVDLERELDPDALPDARLALQRARDTFLGTLRGTHDAGLTLVDLGDVLGVSRQRGHALIYGKRS